MACWKEEIFGPVACITRFDFITIINTVIIITIIIIRFDTEEEGVRLANDTDRGLAAFLYSTDYRWATSLS